MECLPSWARLKISAGGQTLIDGIADKKGEKWSELDKKVRQMLPSNLRHKYGY